MEIDGHPKEHMMQESVHRYPSASGIKNAFNLVIKVCFMCGGLVFLLSTRPQAWQAWVFVSLFLAFMAFGAYGNICNILDTSRVVVLSTDGIRSKRWGNQISFLSWDEVKTVRDKGRLGGIWIDSNTKDQVVAIEHTISDLENFKAQLRQRCGPWDETEI